MNYKTKLSYIDSTTVIKNITKSSINYILYNIFLETKFNFITYIIEDNFELELAEKEINFYSKDIEIIKFPEWNTIPYDVSSPQIKIQSDRMESIYKLINYNASQKNKKTILIISKNSIIQKVLPKSDYKFLNFYINQNITIEEIRNILEDNCYENVETCINLGNFSINNNTIDLITFNNQAYRISLKNNTIIEIKNFNSDTQISFNNHSKILVLPIRELIFSKQNIQNFKQNYRNLFGVAENDIIYENISKAILYNGCENWLPLFYKNKLETIFNYIPENSIIAYNSNFNKNILNSLNSITEYYNLRISDLKHRENKILYNPIKSNLLYIDENELKTIMNNYVNIIFDVNNRPTAVKTYHNRLLKYTFKLYRYNKLYSRFIFFLQNSHSLLMQTVAKPYYELTNSSKLAKILSLSRFLKISSIFCRNSFLWKNSISSESNKIKYSREIDLDFKAVPNFFNESKEVFKSLKKYLE